MYSPKIKEDLIPKLYVLAKEISKPMTVVVSEIIENYLENQIRDISEVKVDDFEMKIRQRG